MSDRFVVTGAHGCVGAWVVAELVREGTEVVALDVGAGRGRTELLLDEEQLAARRLRPGRHHRIAVIPRRNARRPPGGAAVPVLPRGPRRRCARQRRRHGQRLRRGASRRARSLSTRARSQLSPTRASTARGSARTKGSAAAYWAEDRFPSIGVRAALVYGVGRDRGITASMTLAMEAAARGEPFHIVHGGSSPLNHAGDLARIFVRAARAVSTGAAVYDAGGREHQMADVVAAIEAAAPDAQITFEDAPFAATPPSFDGSFTGGGARRRRMAASRAGRARHSRPVSQARAWLGSPS